MLAGAAHGLRPSASESTAVDATKRELVILQTGDLSALDPHASRYSSDIRVAFNVFDTLLAARAGEEIERAAAYRKMTTIFLEHNPWIVVVQPFEDYGLRRYVEFTPNPDQQLELRRFNFRLRRA